MYRMDGKVGSVRSRELACGWHRFCFVVLDRYAECGGFAVKGESTVECGCDCTSNRYV